MIVFCGYYHHGFGISGRLGGCMCACRSEFRFWRVGVVQAVGWGERGVRNFDFDTLIERERPRN